MRESLDEIARDVIQCRQCPRLVAYREAVARAKRRPFQDWDYWGRPVPGFGDPQARLLVVGLAPAAHGANRTGRMFTGDSSGDFLMAALYRAGFANQPTSTHREDGLVLRDVYLTAVVRCAPPGNRPSREELANCRPYLIRELQALPRIQVVVALGQIATEGVLAALRALGYDGPRPAFRHGGLYPLGAGWPVLITSYHPSRQNTQTGRLTPEMFDAIWALARQVLQE
ncbi:uracil-DNA glycosylase [Thermoflexus sp.]|uniref:uracil-DNA glycosylase n=1 Tax=Thermoflexus sp. TaxID=1969742 RepID=UPI001772C3CC|nr:uracil-DNA glycosylase [Thermoflexus sp.]